MKEFERKTQRALKRWEESRIGKVEKLKEGLEIFETSKGTTSDARYLVDLATQIVNISGRMEALEDVGMWLD